MSKKKEKKPKDEDEYSGIPPHIEWIENNNNSELNRIPFLTCRNHDRRISHNELCTENIRRSNVNDKCHHLYNVWIKGWLDSQFKDNTKARKKYVLKHGKSICNMRYIFFERMIDTDRDRLDIPCACYVDQIQLVRAYGDSVVAIFCLEYGTKAKQEEANYPEEKKQKIEDVDQDYPLACSTWIIPQLYFLGFLQPDSTIVTLGTTIPPGTKGVHGCMIESESLLIQSEYLSFDLNKLLKDDKECNTSLGIGVNSMTLADPNECKPLIPAPSRNFPSIWIYIYYWDPPKNTETDIYVMDNINFDEEVMHRVKTLVDIEKEMKVGGLTREQYQQSQLPINNKTQMTRDRLCMHFLVTSISMASPQLIDWYIRAESIALENNLRSLKDMDDRLLTLKENHFDIVNVTKKGEINILNSFESYLCNIQEKRMRTAVKYARPHITAMIDNEKITPSEDDIDETSHIKANPMQATLDLAQKCLNYIRDNANFNDVSNQTDSDDDDDE